MNKFVNQFIKTIAQKLLPEPIFTKLQALWQTPRSSPYANIEEYFLLNNLKKNVSHIFGPLEINYAEDELVVLCVVRNGALYMRSFIDHYLGLGVKHIVFLDNDSTDETVSIASTYDNVTILQTSCPNRIYETAMRKYLVNRFSKNRWNLFADIDELFDYPYSNQISLNLLLSYLNQNRYTAVVTQMLDMFSDQPLNQLKSDPNDRLKETYPYYDISNIRQANYYFGTLSNQDIKMHFGGIRRSFFGTDNGLTKASLTFIDKNIKTFVAFHHTKNSRIADFTCVLLHYPFLSSFHNKVAEAVQTHRYRPAVAMREYQMYWHRLKQEPDITFKTDTAHQFIHSNRLIDSGFLVVSENFVNWVRNQDRNYSRSHRLTSPDH